MTSLSGVYFDGKTARGTPVQLTFSQDELFVSGDNVAISTPIANLNLSPRLGRTRRQITFADGAICEFDDDPVLDTWFTTREHQRWNVIARLESHWGMIAAATVLIIGLAAAIAVWGLPWAAQKIAFKVPQQWVDQLGSGTLVALDNALGETSALSAERQLELREKFAALARSAAVPAKFEFRTWPKLGANALALPDSTIVMTDALVQIADDDRELLAVIAHELGHEHERHALQQLLASSGVAALIFVVTGDVSGLSNIIVIAPTVLTHMHHSRALERDADRFGFALLDRENIDPAWFAKIIRKIEAAHREEENQTNKANEKNTSQKNMDQKNMEINDSWLRSHPDSEERAREAEHYRN